MTQMGASSTNLHFRLTYATYMSLFFTYPFEIFTLMSNRNLSQCCMLMFFTKFGSFFVNVVATLTS